MRTDRTTQTPKVILFSVWRSFVLTVGGVLCGRFGRGTNEIDPNRRKKGDAVSVCCYLFLQLVVSICVGLSSEISRIEIYRRTR